MTALTLGFDLLLAAGLVWLGWQALFLPRRFAAVVHFMAFNLLMALVWVVLEAVDVAFTEAAVGAGITTILMLSAVALTGREEKPRKLKRLSWVSLAIVLATGAALVYATADMPHLGAPDAPIHSHVAPRYIEESPREIGIPNVVTSVLASYRGYDTLGETAVVFTAGIAVLVLIGRGFRRREDEE